MVFLEMPAHTFTMSVETMSLTMSARIPGEAPPEHSHLLPPSSPAVRPSGHLPELPVISIANQQYSGFSRLHS